MPEETIRRMRDGMPSQQQFTNFARLIRAAVVEIAFQNKYITQDDCIRLLKAPIRKGLAYDDSGLLYYFGRESLEFTIEAIGDMPEIDIEKLRDYLTDKEKQNVHKK